MRRLALLVAKIYPIACRRRYGQELEALIEDSKPGPIGLIDILKWAFIMQIKSNGLKIALLGIAGAAVAAAWSLAIGDSYVGTAVLGTRDAGAATASIQKAMSRHLLWPIIEKNRLYESDRNRIPNEEIVNKLRQAIRVGGLHERGAKQQAIIISFQGPDRQQAKAVTEDLASLLLTDRENINRLIEISSPAWPISPNRTTIATMGLIAGLLAGATFLRVMNKRRAV